MSNNKQTLNHNPNQSSVDWVIGEIMQHQKSFYGVASIPFCIIEHAKAMHKEEIKASYADGYKEGYKRALDYMTDTIKNKIEVMENANNEFKKGTANTTHITFLCTEFVSDASKGATLPRCIRCGKTQRIHPIITKNNEQQ